MEEVAEIKERMQRARRSFDDLKAEMARIIVGHEESHRTGFHRACLRRSLPAGGSAGIGQDAHGA